MYRHLVPPFTTPAVSNTISLFCLAIAILSFTIQYVLGFHLTNMCNTICLIFLTASIATRIPSPSPVTRVPDASRIVWPPPSTHTSLSPTPYNCLLHPDVQGLNSFLDLTSEESFQDSGLGLSVSSLEDVSSEDETPKSINPPEDPDINPDVRCPVISGGKVSPFRDQPSPSLSESSFQLPFPDTPGTDHDEDEEYVTLGVMVLQRSTVWRYPAEAGEDPIMNLVDRLAELSLGSAPSKPAAELKELRSNTQRTKPSTTTGNVTERPFGPTPASCIFPKLANCCGLASSAFTPDSWEDYDFCYDCSAFHRFIQPMDEDAFFRSTRLAADNLGHFRSSHYLLLNKPADHRTLGDIFRPFGSTAERHFGSRLHGGVLVYRSAFGVVDFSSEGDALGAFRALQGRRIKGEKAHWRLEFLDPEDVTFGDRLPTIHSEPPLELIRRLDVVAGEPQRIDNIPHPPSPPVSVRALKVSWRKRSARANAQSCIDHE